MQIRRLLICSLFFVLSLIFFFFPSQSSSIPQVLATFTMPIEEWTYREVALASTQKDKSQKMLSLATSLFVNERLHALEKENSALRDQFATTSPSPLSVFPCQIVGMPRFIPGISYPETLILNCGESQGVKTNTSVVVKNVLLGKVAKTTQTMSLVTLVTNTSMSFTATTQRSGALGIVTGQGSGKMQLQNVELSNKLSKGDVVITKGNEDLNGTGFPPGLIVGTINAVNKVPSALFQSASLTAPIDVTKLDTVFIKHN